MTQRTSHRPTHLYSPQPTPHFIFLSSSTIPPHKLCHLVNSRESTSNKPPSTIKLDRKSSHGVRLAVASVALRPASLTALYSKEKFHINVVVIGHVDRYVSALSAMLSSLC